LRTCRRCEAEVAQEYRDANPEIARATHERHRRKKGVPPFQPAQVKTDEEKRAEWRAAYWRNRDNRLAYMARWAREHPDWNRAKVTARRAFESVGPIDPLVVLEMCDGVCRLCGEDVDPDDFHVDHDVPVSRGGEHHLANLQVAHPACNRRKHNLLTDEYWERRAACAP
jgi:5-methylcytosine-specific restriction endonuclease McrA